MKYSKNIFARGTPECCKLHPRISRHPGWEPLFKIFIIRGVSGDHWHSVAWKRCEHFEWSIITKQDCLAPFRPLDKHVKARCTDVPPPSCLYHVSSLHTPQCHCKGFAAGDNAASVTGQCQFLLLDERSSAEPPTTLACLNCGARCQDQPLIVYCCLPLGARSHRAVAVKLRLFEPLHAALWAFRKIVYLFFYLYCKVQKYF